MAADRRTLPTGKRRRSDALILKTLLDRKEIRAAKTICTYVSTSEEVDTIRIILAFIKKAKRVVVPKVKHDELVLYRIDSLDDFVPGSFGVLEPKAVCQQVSVSIIDVFIVPGITFDKKGYRLGWGKGYYDRLLATVSVPKIGLAYAFQIVPRLDHATYDIPMDTVITEKS